MKCLFQRTLTTTTTTTKKVRKRVQAFIDKIKVHPSHVFRQDEIKS